MPTVTNDVLTKSPKGKLLGINTTAIPVGYDFVICPAADGYIGKGINDPGSYVRPNWAKQVDEAYKKGVLVGAQLTLRIQGGQYPIDTLNPSNDRQLQGFLYALKNKTYAFVVLNPVIDDSQDAAVKAINFFGDQLRKATGKRVFLACNRNQWEGKENELFNNMIALPDTPWSLLIFGQSNPTDGKVYTPGHWSITRTRNMLWDRGGEYIMWMDYAFNAQFLGIENWPLPPVVEPEPQDPPAEDEPDDDTQTGGEVSTAVLGQIAAALERIAVAVEKIAAFFEKVFK